MRKAPFSILRFLASASGAFGAVVLLMVACLRLRDGSAWSDTRLGGLSGMGWLLLGAGGLLAAAMLMVQSRPSRGRRSSTSKPFRRFLGSALTAFGVVILLTAAWYRVWGAGVLGLDYPGGLSWSWWIFMGSTALLAATILFVQVGAYRRLEVLQKAVLLSVLAHLAITSGLSLVYLSGGSVKSDSLHELVTVGLNLSPEIELGAKIRQHVEDLPLSDPTRRDALRSEIAVAKPSTRKPLETKVQPAPATAEPLPLLEARAPAAPKSAEEMAKADLKTDAQSPTLRGPKGFRKLSQQEQQAEAERADESRQQQRETQQPAEFRQPSVAAKPARVDRQKLSEAAAATRAPAEAPAPQALKPAVTAKAPEANPELAAGAKVSTGEQQAAAQPLPGKAPLGKAGAAAGGAKPLPVAAQRGQVGGASLAARTDLRPAKDEAGEQAAVAAPAPADVSAAPKGPAASSVHQGEAQPATPGNVQFSDKLGKAGRAGAGPKELAVAQAPAGGGSQSLARASASDGRVAGVESPAAGPSAAAAGEQLQANPAVAAGAATAVSASEAAPGNAGPGGGEKHLADVRTPVVTSGSPRVDARPANVKTESLSARADIYLPAGEMEDASAAAPAPSAVASAGPESVGQDLQQPRGISGKASAAEGTPVIAGQGRAPGLTRLSAGPSPQAAETGGVAVAASAAHAGGGGSLAGPSVLAAQGGSAAAAGQVEAIGPATQGPRADAPQGIEAPAIIAGGAAGKVAAGEASVLARPAAGGGGRLGSASGGAVGGGAKEVALSADPSAGASGSLASGAAVKTAPPGVVAEAVAAPASPAAAGSSQAVQVEAAPAGGVPAAIAAAGGEAKPGEGPAPAAGVTTAAKLSGASVGGETSAPKIAAPAAPAAEGSHGSLAALTAAGGPQDAGAVAEAGPVVGGPTVGGAVSDKPLAEIQSAPGRVAAGREVAPVVPGPAAVAHGPLVASAAPAAPIPLAAAGIDSSIAAAEAGNAASLAQAAATDVRPAAPVIGAAPALGGSPAAGVAPTAPDQVAPPEWLFQREAKQRQELVTRMGGSKETENAVAMALDFLARSQEPEGRWTHFYANPAPGKRGRHPHDLGLTGLATLCFLASDHTPASDDKYKQTTARALDWIIAQDAGNGDLRRNGANMYGQGMASLALAEAAVMTRDGRYRDAAIRAARFIVAAQNAKTGGWRYHPGDEGDTSVLGWQVMALFSASHLGVEIPAATRAGALRWLDGMSSRSPQRVLSGYVDAYPSPAMTAEAAFSRILLGQKLTDAQQKEICDYLMKYPPGKGADDVYQYYYTALTLMQFQNDAWHQWNPKMQQYLLERQVRDGPSAGSWPPNTRHSLMGGRIYDTALSTLMLEVYYRYLPMYKKSGE